MKLKIIELSLTFFLIIPNIWAIPIIEVTFQPQQEEYTQRLIKKIKKNGSLGHYGLAQSIHHPSEAGIFASYSGFLGSSNNIGTIIFPRKHVETKLFVVITPEIMPIAINAFTIHHWELIKGQPVECYMFELQEDQTTHETFWHTIKISAPENGIIPVEALIIFAKPKYFHIIQDTSPSLPGSNLLLPPIYISKGINVMKNALYVLHIRHFFASAQPFTQQKGLHYHKHATI